MIESIITTDVILNIVKNSSSAAMILYRIRGVADGWMDRDPLSTLKHFSTFYIFSRQSLTSNIHSPNHKNSVASPSDTSCYIKGQIVTPFSLPPLLTTPSGFHPLSAPVIMRSPHIMSHHNILFELEIQYG